MSDVKRERYNIVRGIEKLLEKAKEQDKKDYDARRTSMENLANMNGAEKTKLAMDLIRQVYADLSYLNIDRTAIQVGDKSITYGDLINKIESDMYY